MTVTIYTRQTCYFCVSAKRLLDELGVTYREVPVDGDPERLQEMKQKSGRRTVPQIWVGQAHVGGCDELYDLHESGRLQELLKQSAD